MGGIHKMRRAPMPLGEGPKMWNARVSHGWPGRPRAALRDGSVWCWSSGHRGGALARELRGGKPTRGSSQRLRWLFYSPLAKRNKPSPLHTEMLPPVMSGAKMDSGGGNSECERGHRRYSLTARW